MRLLFITNVFPSPLQPTKGVFNLELVRALSASHEVRVICPVAWTDECLGVIHGSGLAGQRCRSIDGIPVRHPRFYFPPKIFRAHYGRFMWHSVRGAVLEEIERFKPDAIVGYWAHPDGEVAVRAARLAGKPSVIMVGGSDVLLLTAGRARRNRILKVLHSADAVVPVSHHIQEKLIDFGIDPKKLHVVERGVDTTLFCPGNRDEARRRLGLLSDRPILLWVGRMVPVKGLDVLVQACGQLRKTGREFELYLIGDGPMRNSLVAQIHREGVADRVHFHGMVDHRSLPDWYRAADLTVLPSRSEGIPNVLRESLACRTPFVASRVGGVAELSEDLPNRLVPAGDPTALACAIAESFEDSAMPQPPPPVEGWRKSAELLARIVRSLPLSKRVGSGTKPADEAPVYIAAGDASLGRNL